MGFERVYLQQVMVPKWVRVEKEIAYFLENKSKVNILVCALGGSVVTSKNGITAEVIEVNNIMELEFKAKN